MKLTSKCPRRKKTASRKAQLDPEAKDYKKQTVATAPSCLPRKRSAYHGVDDRQHCVHSLGVGVDASPVSSNSSSSCPVRPQSGILRPPRHFISLNTVQTTSESTANGHTRRGLDNVLLIPQPSSYNSLLSHPSSPKILLDFGASTFTFSVHLQRFMTSSFAPNHLTQSLKEIYVPSTRENQEATNSGYHARPIIENRQLTTQPRNPESFSAAVARGDGLRCLKCFFAQRPAHVCALLASVALRVHTWSSSHSARVRMLPPTL